MELERRMVLAVCRLSPFETACFIGSDMNDLQTLLDRCARQHNHLCPRQILGVRIGLAGMTALGFSEPPPKKRLLTILETDGCFADGITTATDCTIGHRTLRIEDYGKTAATFVDTRTSRAVRVAPTLDLRRQALSFVPEESRHYFAQMQAYRTMPDEKLLAVKEVQLTTSVEQIVSRPGVRINCVHCGEEIINQREVILDGQPVCRACAGSAYYRFPVFLANYQKN